MWSYLMASETGPHTSPCVTVCLPHPIRLGRQRTAYRPSFTCPDASEVVTVPVIPVPSVTNANTHASHLLALCLLSVCQEEGLPAILCLPSNIAITHDHVKWLKMLFLTSATRWHTPKCISWLDGQGTAYSVPCPHSHSAVTSDSTK